MRWPVVATLHFKSKINMNRGFLSGLIAVAAAVSMWGVQLPVAQDAFAILDLFHMTSIRFVLPALFMAALLLTLEGPRAMRYDGKFLRASTLGIIGMSCSPLLVFIGMSMSGAKHAAVIVALQPSIAAIALWVLRGIRPANFTIACIATAFLGVVLVVTEGQLTVADNSREVFGGVIVFLGGACWVAYAMGTSHLSGWSTWRITALTMIPGALATLCLTEFLVFSDRLERPALADLMAVKWELAYLSLVGVVSAMLLWNFGNRRIGPQNATLLINLLPVSTFVYRAAQGHRFSPPELIGAGLVILALVANNLYVRTHPVAL